MHEDNRRLLTLGADDYGGIQGGHQMKAKLCPSAPAEKGAVLVGVVQADGLISYLRDKVQVTADFLEIAGRGRQPDQRFRFSSPCQQQMCQQWDDGHCTLPDRFAEIVPNPSNQKLPHCSIRRDCRWFDQAGAAICGICCSVVTNSALQEEAGKTANRSNRTQEEQ